MKESIKKIPIVGFLARWLNNLARLNNLKHKVIVLEDQNISLKSDIVKLQEQNISLNSEVEFLKAEMASIQSTIQSSVAKQIFYQSLSLQQRVDQFIFDANIEINKKISQDE